VCWGDQHLRPAIRTPSPISPILVGYGAGNSRESISPKPLTLRVGMRWWPRGRRFLVQLSGSRRSRRYLNRNGLRSRLGSGQDVAAGFVQGDPTFIVRRKSEFTRRSVTRSFFAVQHGGDSRTSRASPVLLAVLFHYASGDARSEDWTALGVLRIWWSAESGIPNWSVTGSWGSAPHNGVRSILMRN
jgi:hypothetical protein